MVQQLTNGESAPGAQLTPALVGSLILYEYRQSRGRLTSGLKSALRLYAHQQNEINRYTQAAMLNGILRAGREQMRQIVASAESATPEQQARLLGQAKKLQKQMRQASKKLTGLADG